MKKSTNSRNIFKAFEFTKEDEHAESPSSHKFFSIFSNRNKSRKSPVTNNNFLQCFTQGFKTGPKKLRDEPIDVDDCSAAHQGLNPVSAVPGMSPKRDAYRSDQSGNHFSEKKTSSEKHRMIGTIGVVSDDESVTSNSSLDHDETEADECRFGGDIIYPEGDPDAVCISKRDLELLQPNTFINDTIIDFYIKYLENKILPEERHRFHFFNCFFFRKLADLDKDQYSACEGKAAFQRVRKWTQKVNLFEKDYIIIPVNFSLHWSLVIICHLGEVANFTDEIDKCPRVPCILHMDSKVGSHRGLKDLIQSYLSEEWRARQSGTQEDLTLKKLNIHFLRLELPQQENSFDCGLFVLHYADLFLKEAPVNLNPFQMTKFSNFLTRDWFPPAEASRKRAYIQKLLFKMLEDNNTKKAFPSSGNIERERVIELSEDMCSSSRICSDVPVDIQREQEDDISAVSPVVNCKRKSRLLSWEFVEHGATAGSLPNSLRPKKIWWSPIQEAEEIEHISNTPPEITDLDEVRIVETSKISNFTTNSEALHAETSRNQRAYVHVVGHDNGDLSSRQALESHVEIVEESSSNSFEEFESFVVEDSPEA